MTTKKPNLNRELWNKEWGKEWKKLDWEKDEDEQVPDTKASVSEKKLSVAGDVARSPYSGYSSSLGNFSDSGDSSGSGMPPGGKDPKNDGNEGRKKKLMLFALIIGIVLLFVIAIGSSLLVRNCQNARIKTPVLSGAERENTLALAKRYIERGEYDRAMNLLDQLLIQNANDADALAMSDEVLALKAGAKLEDFARYQTNVKVDTKNLEKSIDRMAEENARAAKENSKNAAALAEIMKKQEEQSRSDEENRQAELRRQEQAAADDAKRKAYEAELAKQNAALEKLINSINDEISMGKGKVLAGQYDEGLKHFKTAAEKLPADQKKLSASKLSEITGFVFGTANQTTDPQVQKKFKSEAAVYAEKTLSFDPKDSVSHYVLGKLAAEAKDYPKALAELSLAVQNDNTNALYFSELGKVQYSMKKYSEARSSFDSAIKLDPKFEQAMFNLYLANLHLGRTDDAILALRKAVAVNPLYDKAWLELARLQTQKGDYSGAIISYKKVLEINSTNINGLRELGSVYGLQNNYTEAENYYRRALSYNSDDALTNYNLSTALYAQKKFDDALVYAKKSADKDSASALYQYNLALVNDAMGNFDVAAATYAQALKLDPSHVKANVNLGKMYLDMGNPDNALVYLANAVSLDKNSFEAVNNLASAYLAKKDYSNAVGSFLVALKLDPKNETVKMNLAGAYASSGQHDKAKTIYIEVLQKNQNNLDAYVELAKVCIALQDNAAAEKYLIALQAKDSAYRKAEVNGLLESIK